MAIQQITIKIDTEKVVRYGAIILTIVPPSEKLQHGTALVHDPLSLPGFEMKVEPGYPTIAINSQYFPEEKMLPTPKQPEVSQQSAGQPQASSSPANAPANSESMEPATEKHKLQLFGKKNKNKHH